MSMFDKVKFFAPKKNKFDLSHERKLTFNMGELIPILKQDVVPGDKFRVSTETFIRFQPLLAPMMHRVNVYVHYFFVPNRLVWNEWEDFITGGKNGTAEPVFPFIQIDNINKAFWGIGKLPDYFGIPTVDPAVNVINPLNVSALPFRAYQMIYNEYYRDQNLSDPIEFSLDSGYIVGAEMNRLVTMRHRAWEKDYFTSCLPWAQRGSEVLIPIAGVARSADGDIDYGPISAVIDTIDGTRTGAEALMADATPGLEGNLETYNTGTARNARIENIDEVRVRNAETTVREFRLAERLQMWLEKMATGGARYVEQMLVMFGVRSSDARLQRPEYLGGGMAPVSVSEVLSTFQDPSGDGNPQGNMAGHGISVGKSNGFRRFFEEHGTVIGIMSVLPKTAYQNGINRHWQKFDRFDYFWPDFAHIGEQAVLNNELFYNPGETPSIGVDTFGYQARYSEYKYEPSTVHGDFRDNLSFWHMGRIFETRPNLNESFVMSDPTTRVFAVTEENSDHLLCQIYNRVDAIRPMPYFGTPKL